MPNPNWDADNPRRRSVPAGARCESRGRAHGRWISTAPPIEEQREYVRQCAERYASRHAEGAEAEAILGELLSMLLAEAPRRDHCSVAAITAAAPS